ncbi:YMGG-like glycine zipper-containing protein [Roseicella aerolata]|uniref:YMGG-like glycine zipper-containing protein n=1 Tax=Roseicella aerolata TaxID=2883479 RepID=A0A9X1LAG5_9PROT|nr:YMGG-like glycine zipper-containing protein [Roseicella aerolata]
MTHPFLTAAALAAMLGLPACADLDPTTQRTMTGAAGGAAGGALIGAMAGNAGLGAAIGAAAGGTGGFVWDRHVQSRDRAFQQGVAAGRASPPR